MVEKSVIKTVLLEGFPEKKLVKRDKKLVDVGKIYSIIGPRRSGKTYFLFEIIYSLLKKKIDKTQILYLNFEDERLRDLNVDDLQKILDSYYELYPHNTSKKVYCFFDEIQNVPYWQKFVRRLYSTENYEIYITGSSAKLLSKEIATELRGRTWDYNMFPFSFKEYLDALEISVDNKITHSKERYTLKNHFDRYLKIGGFPEVIKQDDYSRARILQNYFDVVLFRDLIERYNLPQPDLVKNTLYYLLNNFSRFFSVNKYYNFLKSQGRKVTKDPLYDLINYIETTMYFFFVPLYTDSEKKRVVNPKKIYIVDNGLVNALLNKEAQEKGWYYENQVFLELKRREYDLFYYSGEKECDFIAIKHNEKKAIQVTLSPELDREKIGLLDAMDKLNLKEGLIITDDIEKVETVKGKKIKYVPLWLWLLE